MPDIGQTGAGHKADITGSENRNLHAILPENLE